SKARIIHQIQLIRGITKWGNIVQNKSETVPHRFLLIFHFKTAFV
ncbi:glutamate decarboxylase isozyme, partial [Shigella dysenteriae]